MKQRFQEKINNNYKEENIMSHFITLVFTKENGSTVEELLAPYDENIVYAPYVKYTREQEINSHKNWNGLMMNVIRT